MVPRFLVAGVDPSRGTATLSADEAHHAARVLRLRSGDEVALFDGAGREWTGRIARVDRGGVTIAQLAPVQPVAEPAVSLLLAQAVLKGEAMDAVVRDATMMGAADVQPLVSAHTAIKLRPGTAERWRRIALASAKQCRRATLPQVREPRPFREWVGAQPCELKLMFVEPAAGRAARSLHALIGSPRPARAALLVGPEGGWSPEEIDAAGSAGWIPVTLGSLTLRADAVPLAAIAVVRFVWEA